MTNAVSPARQRISEKNEHFTCTPDQCRPSPNYSVEPYQKRNRAQGSKLLVSELPPRPSKRDLGQLGCTSSSQTNGELYWRASFRSQPPRPQKLPWARGVQNGARHKKGLALESPFPEQPYQTLKTPPGHLGSQTGSQTKRELSVSCICAIPGVRSLQNR